MDFLNPQIAKPFVPSDWLGLNLRNTGGNDEQYDWMGAAAGCRWT
jgi:hypothetical protein